MAAIERRCLAHPCSACSRRRPRVARRSLLKPCYVRTGMTSRRARERETRDLHFLNKDGMVACNPRDREAAHRAEVEGIATEHVASVTCRKCRAILWSTGKQTDPVTEDAGLDWADD